MFWSMQAVHFWVHPVYISNRNIKIMTMMKHKNAFGKDNERQSGQLDKRVLETNVGF